MGRARGFGAPLWWMDPPFEIVRHIVNDARESTAWTGGGKLNPAHRQLWFRRVMHEADRLLAEAHIYVEGAGQ